GLLRNLCYYYCNRNYCACSGVFQMKNKNRTILTGKATREGCTVRTDKLAIQLRKAFAVGSDKTHTCGCRARCQLGIVAWRDGRSIARRPDSISRKWQRWLCKSSY